MYAKEIANIDYGKFGTLFELNRNFISTNSNCWEGDGWIDFNTKFPVLRQPCFIGITTASPYPCKIGKLERHLHTDEILLPMEFPISFLLADSYQCDLRLENLTAVTLAPGQVFSIASGVWHSAAHGFLKKASYYYLANIYENEPTEWLTIEDGPVILEI